MKKSNFLPLRSSLSTEKVDIVKGSASTLETEECVEYRAGQRRGKLALPEAGSF